MYGSFYVFMGFGILLGPSRTILDRFWTKTESDECHKVTLVLGWGTTSKVLKMLSVFVTLFDMLLENLDLEPLF